MARIRTIKPEFWTAEQIMECSPNARLLFIGMWNFCDDAGIHPASCKTLKAEVFPSDDITASEIGTLVAELEGQGLIEEYEVDGRVFWLVTGWHHQKIDQPTYKHPRPDGTIPEGAPKRRAARASSAQNAVFAECSPNNHRTNEECSPPEGKGREGSKPSEDKSSLVPDLTAGNQQDGTADEKLCHASGAEKSHAEPDDCPHVDIIALYHELLPECPPVKSWHNGRAGMLRQRWREDAKRQSLDWWRRFFGYVHESDFLSGRSHSQPGRPPFVADLEWLIRPNNLAKVIEGKYHHAA